MGSNEADYKRRLECTRYDVLAGRGVGHSPSRDDVLGAIMSIQHDDDWADLLNFESAFRVHHKDDVLILLDYAIISLSREMKAEAELEGRG